MLAAVPGNGKPPLAMEPSRRSASRTPARCCRSPVGCRLSGATGRRALRAPPLTPARHRPPGPIPSPGSEAATRGRRPGREYLKRPGLRAAYVRRRARYLRQADRQDPAGCSFSCPRKQQSMMRSCKRSSGRSATVGGRPGFSTSATELCSIRSRMPASAPPGLLGTSDRTGRHESSSPSRGAQSRRMSMRWELRCEIQFDCSCLRRLAENPGSRVGPRPVRPRAVQAASFRAAGSRRDARARCSESV